MPQIFNDAVMTTDGKALLSREIAGECMIQITRMAVGNGIYTESEKTIEELQTMTGLKNEVQSTGLSALKRIDRTSVLVSGVFTNDTVDTAYHINEIGLFAQEKGSKGTEVLYSIAVVAEREGEIMPASEGKNPVRIIQDWIVTVSNSANATIESLPDGAFAMAADVGNTDELDTKEKKNLVSAVNETLRRLIVTDTSGVLGKKDAEVEAQALLDEIADKVMEKLLLKTGDSADNTVDFESSDDADAQSWTDVALMDKKEKHKSLFGKISTMFKNVRYLYRLLGTTDISVIKNGTVTGILNELDHVAFTGIYSDLHNKPLALPASDVYAWAKQATKPAYSKSEVGLGNVNNTSDKDKPVSTEQQTALNKKVNFADITRSTAVNIAGKKALDAMEKNPSVEGTLAHDISQIYSKLSAKNPFNIALKRDYDYKTASGWKGLLSWNDNNGRTGYLQENVSDGKITLYLTNERGDILINGNSVAWIVNNINNLKSSRTWNVILAAQADGTHEIPALDGTEALLMLGYVYRIQATMTISMNIFKTARGEGGKILFEGLTIEVVDDTHIKVTNLANDYLFRVFVR